VLSFNVWGRRGKVESYKVERINAIGNEIRKGEYDLYLLQELWMENDYNNIKKKIPAGFQMTDYKVGSLRNSCRGSLCIGGCLG
jgi:hypothetical protein